VRPQDAAQAAAQRKLSDAQAAHKLAALADEVTARAVRRAVLRGPPTRRPRGGHTAADAAQCPPAAQNAALVAEVKAVRARAADEALAAAAAAAALRSQIAAEEEEVRRC
jgi:hypothetical protein